MGNGEGLPAEVRESAAGVVAQVVPDDAEPAAEEPLGQRPAHQPQPDQPDRLHVSPPGAPPPAAARTR